MLSLYKKSVIYERNVIKYIKAPFSNCLVCQLRGIGDIVSVSVKEGSLLQISSGFPLTIIEIERLSTLNNTII